MYRAFYLMRSLLPERFARTPALLLALACLLPLPANADKCIGHIFFYNLEEGKGESDTDADYAYYYHKTIAGLSKQGISFSAHTQLPINHATCFSSDVAIAEDQLMLSLGYIFVRPDLEVKIVGGVLTDTDVSNVINELFNSFPVNR